LQKYSYEILQKFSEIEGSTKKIAENLKNELENSYKIFNKNLDDKISYNLNDSISGKSSENEIGNKVLFLSGILQGIKSPIENKFQKDDNHKKCKEKIAEISELLKSSNKKIMEYEIFCKQILKELYEIKNQNLTPNNRLK